MPTATANAPANNVLQHPATRSGVAPDFAISIKESADRMSQVKRFVREQMFADLDYGCVPGTPKPTLFKPGAEKLLAIFGLATRFETIHRVENFNDAKPFVSYEVRVIVINKRTQNLEAEGVGSCNSRERKYARQDAANVANTILRMAKKRALIDATLIATRTSALFQSGDFAEDDPEPAEPAPPVRNAQRPAPRPQPQQEPAPPRAPALVATRKQLDAAEKMRLRAIELGYLTDAKTEPKPIAAGATAREAKAKYDRWKAFVDQAESQQQTAEGAQPQPVNRGRKYAIPKHVQPRNCTSCGAQIWFVRSDEGASLPIDKSGYSHFTSCPNASQHSKTSKPGLPKYIKHVWAVAAANGLDKSPETRAERIKNSNEVLVNHGLAPIASFNDLDEQRAGCLASALDMKLLTWGQPVPVGEADA